MPDCRSQVILCDLPVRFDTYSGCSHGCRYCFSQRNGKVDLANIRVAEGVAALRAFCRGGRTGDTRWCDWDIPVHWGGMSDPFQPCEAAQRQSLACLEELADSQYPVVVSTKGRLAWTEPWLGLLKRARAVVQLSLVSPKYDELEPGAPPYAERLQAISDLAGCLRVVIRVQPYVPGVLADVLAAIPRFREAGAYGIVVEGHKSEAKLRGRVKIAGDWCLPEPVLRKDFYQIRQACHENGLRFYSGENRLRGMGDDGCCCGIDGLDGFRPNRCNMNHEEEPYTSVMKEPGTGRPFQGLVQDTLYSRIASGLSYADCMDICKRTVTYREAMGRINRPGGAG